MQKNDLIQHNGTILRILAINDSNALVLDCLKRNMPHWCNIANIESFAPCTEQELAEQTDVELFDIESLDAATRKIVHDRYTVIAGVLPFISDDKMRSLVTRNYEIFGYLTFTPTENPAVGTSNFYSGILLFICELHFYVLYFEANCGLLGRGIHLKKYIYYKGDSCCKAGCSLQQDSPNQ